MNRAFTLGYGLCAYLLFFVTFLYAIGFVGNLVVPKSIDAGTLGVVAEADTLPRALINIALLSLFAVQHTVMARPAFKRWWTRFVPRPIERSTFVVASSLCLIVLYIFWQPMTATTWHVEPIWARAILWALFGLGWAIVLYGSFLIDHFDLFGVRQVFAHWKGRSYTHPPFMVRSLYRFVRHPLMVGFIIAFWATPHMSAGHLLFAAMTTAYIIFGVQFEERDLMHFLGDDYKAYRRRTPMFIPLTKRAGAQQSDSESRTGQARH